MSCILSHYKRRIFTLAQAGRPFNCVFFKKIYVGMLYFAPRPICKNVLECFIQSKGNVRISTSFIHIVAQSLDRVNFGKPRVCHIVFACLHCERRRSAWQKLSSIYDCLVRKIRVLVLADSTKIQHMFIDVKQLTFVPFIFESGFIIALCAALCVGPPSLA